ncbi:putative DNA binding domain-containing protein [Patescibacteria group bacterium]|nr:putative DNA binding domain-containing protein [Patescibacteria group bacterium]
MNKNKIEKLIKGGENQKMEFKSKISDGLGDSICSFANTNNGTILLGIGDNGKIIGIDKKYEEKIANIAHTCKPSVYPDVENIEIENKNIFVIEIKKSDSLHSFGNIAYKRIASHDKPLSPEEVIEIAKYSGKIKWDEQICKEAKLTDIDEGKVKWFLRKAKYERRLEVDPNINLKEALTRLNLLKNNKLTNTAILMFGKEPQKFLLQSEVRCAKFKGTIPVKPFIDMKVIDGAIYEQVDLVEKFVLNNIKKSAWLVPGKVERVEKWEYPLNAIREAITNAICHRDYDSSSNMQVRIFDDRIEVWNPGSLPEGWTVDTLKKKHESKPKNPLIAKLFFMIKRIEQWGTGTNEMIRETVKHGLPEPVFEDTKTSIIVTFRKFIFDEEILKELNERQRKAIEYLKTKHKITTQEYVDLVKASIATAKRDLGDLKKKKIIKFIGSAKTGYYSF